MPHPVRCVCGAPLASVHGGCGACEAAPSFTRMRLLRCECGVRRPGDEAACPGCGGVGGDEVVVRMANGRAGGWPAPVAEVTALRPARPAASRCGMCATPMAPAAPGSDLQTCEVCDVAVATAC